MTDLESALENADAELREGIATALEENPELLRETLRDIGALEAAAKNEEPDLTEAEEELLSFVNTLGNPKSASEIREMIETERPELIEQYGSFKHRSWLSNKLNKLCRHGYIGKYRDGRTVRYTSDPVDGVRRWALHNNQFAEELSPADADEIVADTGMQRDAVITAIASIKE